MENIIKKVFLVAEAVAKLIFSASYDFGIPKIFGKIKKCYNFSWKCIEWCGKMMKTLAKWNASWYPAWFVKVNFREKDSKKAIQRQQNISKTLISEIFSFLFMNWMEFALCDYRSLLFCWLRTFHPFVSESIHQMCTMSAAKKNEKSFHFLYVHKMHLCDDVGIGCFESHFYWNSPPDAISFHRTNK